MTDLIEGTVERVHDVYPTRLGTPAPPLRREDPVVWGSADDGPMDATTLASYDEKGYLTIDELVTPDEVELFRAELGRLSDDPTVRADERTIVERQSQEVRSIFEVHKVSDVFAKIAHDPRVVGRARQLLGSDVYIHQSRVNFKPGFDGKEFYWHSDFETWHAEDGMPRMRAVSISISLTDNYSFNGPLMIMPGSHKTYVSCVGETPGRQLQVLVGPAGCRYAGRGRPHRAGRTAWHRRPRGTSGWRHDVRLQLHARLERQHHALRALERLHRLQQRREHLRRAVRRRALAAGVHRVA